MLECGALGPEFHRDTPPERSLCVLYVFPELQGEIGVLCVPAKLPVGGKDCLGISSADSALFEPSSLEAEVPTGCHGLTWCYGVETGASGCSPPGP